MELIFRILNSTFRIPLHLSTKTLTGDVSDDEVRCGLAGAEKFGTRRTRDMEIQTLFLAYMLWQYSQEKYKENKQ